MVCYVFPILYGFACQVGFLADAKLADITHHYSPLFALNKLPLHYTVI